MMPKSRAEAHLLLSPQVHRGCGDVEGSRSCAKILLVKVYPAGEKEKAVKMDAVLDEQSNKPLAKSEFFHLFNIQTNSTPDTLRTRPGKIDTSGRRGPSFILSL
ncbi:hypothetical protein D4764_01G0009810 [Takifugu flavidus]|uniref:Uncharacterized protein n=1 Tax=Takifugu flavidus TaxID=433684 RepID=A0A5C6PQH7_9TELE|nr:hypothetical protein D4764_01G0009810 [Takifugu flavidus]